MTDSTFTFHLDEQPVLPELRPTDGMQLRKAPWNVEGAYTLTADGVEAQPLPPAPRHSDGVAAVVLLSLILGLFAVSRSWRYVRHGLVEFFYPSDHPNIYDEHTTDAVMHGGLPLFACVALQEALALHLIMPNLTLGLAVASMGVFWTIRTATYHATNTTFFSPHDCRLWHDGFCLLNLLEATLLWALTAHATFVGTLYLLETIILAVVVVKILLLVKTQRTFFAQPTRVLHLFLYFCTLEVVPLLILVPLLQKL